MITNQYRCPPDINFRFWLFVLATGAEVWENNIDYMFWIQGRNTLREAIADLMKREVTDA